MKLTIDTATDYAMKMKTGETVDIQLPMGTHFRIFKHKNWAIVNLKTFAVNECINHSQLYSAIEALYVADFKAAAAA